MLLAFKRGVQRRRGGVHTRTHTRTFFIQSHSVSVPFHALVCPHCQQHFARSGTSKRPPARTPTSSRLAPLHILGHSHQARIASPGSLPAPDFQCRLSSRALQGVILSQPPPALVLPGHTARTSLPHRDTQHARGCSRHVPHITRPNLIHAHQGLAGFTVFLSHHPAPHADWHTACHALACRTETPNTHGCSQHVLHTSPNLLAVSAAAASFVSKALHGRPAARQGAGEEDTATVPPLAQRPPNGARPTHAPGCTSRTLPLA
jgi:hypothetical protein